MRLLKDIHITNIREIKIKNKVCHHFIPIQIETINLKNINNIIIKLALALLMNM